MLLNELYEYYGTWTNLMREIGLGNSTYQVWRRQGYIPFLSQLRIENKTKGLFKACESHGKPPVPRKGRTISSHSEEIGQQGFLMEILRLLRPVFQVFPKEILIKYTGGYILLVEIQFPPLKMYLFDSQRFNYVVLMSFKRLEASCPSNVRKTVFPARMCTDQSNHSCYLNQEDKSHWFQALSRMCHAIRYMTFLRHSGFCITG